MVAIAILPVWLAWAFPVAAVQQWDFQQPGFRPHVFQGVALDSGRCSLPVIDIFAPVPIDDGLEAEEARITMRDAVPAPDRDRWRAFLAHSRGAAGEGVPRAWVTRRQQLLRAVARRQRPEGWTAEVDHLGLTQQDRLALPPIHVRRLEEEHGLLRQDRRAFYGRLGLGDPYGMDEAGPLAKPQWDFPLRRVSRNAGSR